MPRPQPAGDKSAAVDAARALMHAEGITAAAASRRVAADFGLSPETLRRSVTGVVYAKSTQGDLRARVERLELTVAELSRRLEAVERPGFSGMPGAGRATSLSEAQVREIRSLRATAGVTYDRLAQRFGVSTATISRIVNRQSWAHVP
ncbi:helix-turn-helix domain-containing protein [Nocardia asteroides]|uniref:helix-turn-helix domain-containing protein n=1 Tax=Nocardia asteroides TaxID=1824 RepID=UPI0037C7D077